MSFHDIIILCMEMVGTIAFSASGALTGIKCRMDIFGICVLAVITSVGGGMMRDVLLRKVPDALLNPAYVVVAAAVALFVSVILYFKKDLLQGHFSVLYDRVMLMMDTIGLGIFTVSGVIIGIHAGYKYNLFLLVVLGTLTGVGGGLLRDVLAEQPPYIFVKHFYACASIIGALVCALVYPVFGEILAMAAGSLLVIVIRYLAIRFQWNLPHIEMDKE